MYRQMIAITIVATLAAGCVELGAEQCESDEDCRYARVCSATLGRCVTPVPEPEPDAGPEPDAPPVEAQPRVSATPDTIAFERIDNRDPTWRRAWKMIRIRSVGDEPLVVERVELAADPAFTLEYPGRDTPPRGVELAPGEAIEVRVWYETLSNEPSTGAIVVHSNDPGGELEVPLVADANPPCVDVEPAKALFFTPHQTDSIVIKPVTLTNCSDASPLAIRSARLRYDGGGVFAIRQETLPARLPEYSALIAPGESADIDIIYDNIHDEWNAGDLVLRTNVAERRQIHIALMRLTDQNDCPLARGGARDDDTLIFVDTLRTHAGTHVQLSAAHSIDPDGDIARVEWTTLERPEGSNARLQPSNTVAEPTLAPDVAGHYLYELQVWDDHGATSCTGPAQVRVIAWE